MKKVRRAGLLILILSLVSVALVFAAGAKESEDQFPNKPIRIISPWGLGGTSGLMGQVMAPFAEEYFGVPVRVEERSGGAGVVGTAYLQSQPADGYTLVITTKGNIITTPLLAGAPYTYEDFVPLLQTSTQPLVVLVGGKTPFKTLDELFDANRADPTGIRWANTGFGNQPHLFFEIFKLLTGIDMVSISFDGWGGASTALLGGHVEAAIGNLDGTAIELIEEGGYRALAVFDTHRHPALPDIPTIAETGMTTAGKEGAYLEYLIWRGLAVSAGTPASIVKKLEDGFAEIMKNPALLEKLESLELDINYLNSADSMEVWKAEYDAWSGFIPRIQ